MKLIQQSLVIILTVAIIYLVGNTPLLDYTAQILGILIIFSLLYIFIKKRKQKSQPAGKQEELFVGSNLEFFAIATGIMLTITLTDGLYSNLFFLVYFLLFGMTFMFEPLTVFVFLIGLILLFLQQALAGDIFANVVRLGSLVLLSPIAFFFGKEFRRREQLEDEIEEKTERIINDIEIMVEEERDKMTPKEAESADDIATQANELREDIQK